MIKGCPYRHTAPAPEGRGKNGLLFVDCNHWICDYCAKVKVDKIIEKLTSFDCETVHVLVAYRHADAVKNVVRRPEIKPCTLRLSLDGPHRTGLLLVSTLPAAGRGWTTTPMSLREAGALIRKRPEGARYTRCTWTEGWSK